MADDHLQIDATGSIKGDVCVVVLKLGEATLTLTTTKEALTGDAVSLILASEESFAMVFDQLAQGAQHG